MENAIFFLIFRNNFLNFFFCNIVTPLFDSIPFKVTHSVNKIQRMQFMKFNHKVANIFLSNTLYSFEFFILIII